MKKFKIYIKLIYIDQRFIYKISFLEMRLIFLNINIGKYTKVL